MEAAMLSHLLFWRAASAKAPKSGLQATTRSRFEPVNPEAIERLRQRAIANALAKQA
jgi:hypothetical protein